MEDPVDILAHNAAWPAQFKAEKAVLARLLAPWLIGPVEHIGSTAVPGLAAKPVIDIMAPVRSLQASLPAIDAAADVGYRHFPYKTEVMHWFCKPSPEHRTHHLHLVPFGSPLWHDRLAFRDVLREDPLLAAEYAELKRRLGREFRLDREAYTEGKTGFVQRVLEENKRGNHR